MYSRTLADKSKEMSQSMKHKMQERSKKQWVCAYFSSYCRPIQLLGVLCNEWAGVSVCVMSGLVLACA